MIQPNLDDRLDTADHPAANSPGYREREVARSALVGTYGAFAAPGSDGDAGYDTGDARVNGPSRVPGAPLFKSCLATTAAYPVSSPAAVRSPGGTVSGLGHEPSEQSIYARPKQRGLYRIVRLWIV